MEPVDLSIAKKVTRDPALVKDRHPSVRPLFRPYQTDSGSSQCGNSSVDEKSQGDPKSETDTGSDNDTSSPSSPLKPTPCFPATVNAGPGLWPHFLPPNIFPPNGMECTFDPYKAAAVNMAATYPFLGPFSPQCFYVPPYQWYQKRISRPLCGKYVKSGPAASRMTLMALRQRVIQRQQMKFFLHSMSSIAGPREHAPSHSDQNG